MSSKKEDPPINRNSLGWKFFKAILEETDLQASEKDFVTYAAKELQLDLESLQPDLKQRLPHIVVAYMNMWSGWQFKNEYNEGKFTQEHYFVRFQKFMHHKMTMLKGQFRAAQAQIDHESRRTAWGLKALAIQQGVAEFAPHAISIKCPPSMVNTIVFTNTADDVVMKQHMGINWHELTPTQLVNWPSIEITFKNSDLHFSRAQATEYLRYLNFLPHECQNTDGSLIENLEVLPGKTRECFTIKFVQAYVEEYLQALRCVISVDAEKIEEIDTLLHQYIEDLKFLNVNKSIVTNTRILFKLCKVPFIRNKKLVKDKSGSKDEIRVGYCEIITPKIETLLYYFKAQQQETPHISFVTTDTIRKHSGDLDPIHFLPEISYKCTFCHVEFSSPDSRKLIMEHLRSNHKMEQNVRCTVCKRQFDVLNLAACRWRHRCLHGESSAPIATVTVS